jgi:cell division transport system ATP-binding protein
MVYLVRQVVSGKSSLLKTFYAEVPCEGEVANVLGYNMLKFKTSQQPALRREMGIVFQDFQLLTDRTVFENLNFVLKATGWKKKEYIDERIHKVLTAVGLDDKAENRPFELSGGEQQRVAIARAILNNPKLIIADEPTGNLDPETSQEIMKLLFKISKSGTAVIMSTHNIPLVKENPTITFRCQDEKLEEITSDFHNLVMIDDTLDVDETKVRYSERDEI